MRIAIIGASILAATLTGTGQDTAPATVWVRAADGETGTGFCIDTARKRFVTAYHVVGERKTVELFFRTTSVERDAILRDRERLTKVGRIVSAKVIARDPANDLALLETETLPPDVPALKLGFGRVGETIRIVGQRGDTGTLWNIAEGTVRGPATPHEGYFFRGTRLAGGAMLTPLQLPAAVGDSGAAIVAHGRCVGVLTAIDARVPELAYAASVEAIAKLADLPLPVVEPVRLPTGTVWVRPQSTENRLAGWVIDGPGGLIVTTTSDLPRTDRVDVLFGPTTFDDPLGERLAGRLKPAVIVARDVEKGLALLWVPGGAGESMPTAKQAVSAGETVRSINHPAGIRPAWLLSRGIVRQATDHLLVLQLPYQANATGAAVLNDTGEVVGMTIPHPHGGPNLGMAVPIADILKFTVEHPVKIEDRVRLLRMAHLTAPSEADQRHHAETRRLPAEQRMELWERRLTVDPLDADALRGLAELHLTERRWAKLTAIAGALLEVTPLDSEAYAYAAHAAFGRSDDAEAMRQLQAILRIEKEGGAIVEGVLKRASPTNIDELRRRLQTRPNVTPRPERPQ